MSEPPADASVDRPAARRPLVTAPGIAAAVIGVAVVCFAIMTAWVHDTRDPKGVDTTVLDAVNHVGSPFMELALYLTEPMLTVGTCGTIAVVALLLARWDLAVLAVVGPLAGLVLESAVLKPSINRLFGIAEQLSGGAVKAGYAFPSGHETGVTSAAMLIVLICLTTTWSRPTKYLCLGLAALWMAIASFALVRNGYHYFTDTLGGILLGVVVMLATALAIDVVGARFSSPAGRDRSRTARAA